MENQSNFILLINFYLLLASDIVKSLGDSSSFLADSRTVRLMNSLYLKDSYLMINKAEIVITYEKLLTQVFQSSLRLYKEGVRNHSMKLD